MQDADPNGLWNVKNCVNIQKQVQSLNSNKMNTKRNFTVYFELYGKKMKAKVLAENMTDAAQMVKDKIIIHKVNVETDDEFNKIVDLMDNIIDVLDNKK